MLEAKAKDQGHKAQVLSKKKKKVFTKIFKRSPLKNVFQKIFQALHKILTFQKIVLSSSRGQANFRELEASRPRPRTWPLRPRPRTSKCVLEDVLEAKDVLEDSTSDYYVYYTTNTRGAGIIHHLMSMIQGSRPGATGGMLPGRAPPQMTACAPPSEDCGPKKFTGSGLLECKSRPKLVFFVDWHRISWHFWDENLFSFFGDHPFSAGKTAWISDFGRKIPCKFGENLFFLRSPVFGRKIPCKFGEDFFVFEDHL